MIVFNCTCQKPLPMLFLPLLALLSVADNDLRTRRPFSYTSGIMARRFALLLLLLLSLGLSAHARVTRVEVLSRASIAPSSRNAGLPGFEKITARVYFAIRPEEAHNRRIVDLDKAPRNAGRVQVRARLSAAVDRSRSAP